MKFTLEDFKTQVKADTLKVGDKLITEDIGGEVIFEVAEIRKKYIYMVRKYCLPDDYDKTLYGLMDFLNNEYLDTLPQALKDIMGKRNGSKIFVPWFNEVFGEVEDYRWADKSKGKQWKIFKATKGKIRFKENKYGCSKRYWLASLRLYCNYTSFCLVTTSGTPGTEGASYFNGVLPCFKISRDY